eukprot:m.175022 g.175022  ORF g.175022 m.175022 type:complete len:63 (-) comp18347_c0_seq1:2741-2929(-)
MSLPNVASDHHDAHIPRHDIEATDSHRIGIAKMSVLQVDQSRLFAQQRHIESSNKRIACVWA